MKFYCDTKELNDALNIVSKAVASNSTIPHLEGVLLRAKGESLYLTGNNFEISIETSIVSNVVEEGDIVLNCKMFMDIIKRLPKDKVEIKMGENNKVLIKCVNSDYKIIGLNASEFPKVPEIEVISEITLPSKDLKNIISKTMFAVSLSEARQILTGSLFEIENDNLNVVAVDGFRLALKKEKIENTSQFARFIIPGKTQNEISKVLKDTDDKVRLGFGNKHVIIKSENYTIISRLIEGEFLSYKQIIPQEFKFSVSTDCMEFLRCIERAEPIIEDFSKNPIHVIFDEGCIKIKCETSIGQVSDSISADYSGDELEIGFNYKYLHDAISRCEGEKIIFKINSALNPFIIEDKDDDSILFMVLPVRLKN